MKIMVTGAAGFIGMHVAERLLARGDEVIGIDDLNPYYDPALKEARLARLRAFPAFSFRLLDIADDTAMADLFVITQPERVIHLAAQAGVRHSLTHPHAYVSANLRGFLNILEGCRHHGIGHLVYASSSSVYGGNTALPFTERQSVDHPISLYAATKKSNELMAHTYSHLFGLPTTGLRFFTVYGPWGRPDMAPFLFARAMFAGEPIPVFNEGRMIRDFTYIDDVVEGVVRVLDKPASANPAFDSSAPNPAASGAPYRMFNLGNGRPRPLMDYIAALERAIGRKARLELLPMQPGDVSATAADTRALEEWTGFKPETSIEDGVAHFVVWYRGFYESGK